MSTADLPLVPCSECGDTDLAHHVYGTQKRCPDCRRDLSAHDRQVAERAGAQALRDAADLARRIWTRTTNLPHPTEPDASCSFDRWLDVLADALAPRPGAPGVYVIGKCAIHDAPDLDCRVCAAVAAPGGSVSAEQVEAAARETLTPGVNPWSPRFRSGLHDFLAALGVTVTDGGA